MSDYMFMLESHLSTEQSRVVAELQTLAAHANVNLFLTGGAMRDMLGGFPIRDLDFTVEGNGLKLARTLAENGVAEIVSDDENRKSAELRFSGGVTAEISMARQERYPKPGGRPHVHPATIHEDLRGRDFTINAIALSLNRASRGLLLDPNNGLADLEHKELRSVHNYVLYDDPVRILRLIRFRVRLGFAIEERTKLQYENARLAEMEQKISGEELGRELRRVAEESKIAELLEALDQEKLLTLFSPVLTTAKLNLPNFVKLEKARQMIPFGVDLRVESLSLFLYLLLEKLNPRERTALIQGASLQKSEVSHWQKLEANAKKLERELKAAKLQKPSLLYRALHKAPGELVLFLLLRSSQRLVHDRIKNYLQKYLPAALEVTDREVLAAGVQPDSPKFQKVKDELVAARLDVRQKKPPSAPPEAAGPPAPTPHFARSRT